MELHLDRPGLLDGELSGGLVCVDEAAHAELYAAEVARHDDERVGQLVALVSSWRFITPSIGRPAVPEGSPASEQCSSAVPVPIL